MQAFNKWVGSKSKETREVAFTRLDDEYGFDSDGEDITITRSHSDITRRSSSS